MTEFFYAFWNFIGKKFRNVGLLFKGLRKSVDISVRCDNLRIAYCRVPSRDRYGATQRIPATCRRVGDALVELKIEAANVAGVGGVSFWFW